MLLEGFVWHTCQHADWTVVVAIVNREVVRVEVLEHEEVSVQSSGMDFLFWVKLEVPVKVRIGQYSPRLLIPYSLTPTGVQAST